MYTHIYAHAHIFNIYIGTIYSSHIGIVKKSSDQLNFFFFFFVPLTHFKYENKHKYIYQNLI
jgi:hypothetical protein